MSWKDWDNWIKSGVITLIIIIISFIGDKLMYIFFDNGCKGYFMGGAIKSSICIFVGAPLILLSIVGIITTLVLFIIWIIQRVKSRKISST